MPHIWIDKGIPVKRRENNRLDRKHYFSQWWQGQLRRCQGKSQNPISLKLWKIENTSIFFILLVWRFHIFWWKVGNMLFTCIPTKPFSREFRLVNVQLVRILPSGTNQNQPNDSFGNNIAPTQNMNTVWKKNIHFLKCWLNN